jgi:hypothetical protein
MKLRTNPTTVLFIGRFRKRQLDGVKVTIVV